MGIKQKYWIVEDWKKVLFSGKSHFFRSWEEQQFARIKKDEQLNLAYFNEVV